MKFSDLGLSEPILRAVAADGYETPTPIQAQAIPKVLTGGDLLGCAQTGTGKTAAFALPIIHRLTHAGNPPTGSGRKIRVLVLSPTRELAAQIGESFASYGRNLPLKHAVIFGGVNQYSQVKALKHGIDILVATPGRLLDLLNQGHVDLTRVEILVLDEADRMLDLGFLPDVKKIVTRVPKERQTLFFSATMPGDIRQLANSILRNPTSVQVAPESSTAEKIAQSVYHVSKKDKPILLIHCLNDLPVTRALIFTRTKRGADRVTRELNRAGIRAVAIHGDKTQANRERALLGFKANRTPILVATDIAARGIDVDGISHVFNYDIPNVAETYVHRIGRTARAGASGSAVAFCDPEERADLKQIERLIRMSIPVQSNHPEYATRETPDATTPAEESQNGQQKSHAGTKPHAKGPSRRPGRKFKPGRRPSHGEQPANRESSGTGTRETTGNRQNNGGNRTGGTSPTYSQGPSGVNYRSRGRKRGRRANGRKPAAVARAS